jgi:hypothetical protein
MLELDTFLTELYVMADDYCKASKPATKPGPRAGLTAAEVLTLSLIGQFNRFSSEQDFYRFATNHLRGAFPGLPERTRFNRLERSHHRLTAQFALHLCAIMRAQQCPYEALDATAVPVRNAKRRGRGHLAGQAALGHSGRLGWYEGFHLILACSPEGVVTGFGFGPANVNERRLADTFFAARQAPCPELPGAGTQAAGCYVTDKGFSGERPRQAWRTCYGADVVSAPEQKRRASWPTPLERWLSSLRQVVESVFEHLHDWFRLDRDRPHTMEGFWSRLSAKVALHNFCIWINRQIGQPPLTIAGLIKW